MSERFPESWRELSASDPPQRLRGAALTVAGALGRLGLIQRALATPRVHVLLLHHLYPDERDCFRRLLAELAKVSDFVTYSQAAERVREGGIDRPMVTLSFDDGIASCMDAAEVMHEFDAKACFFLCPTVIGEQDESRLRTFCKDGLKRGPYRFMDWAQVEQLLAQGHEVGAHTMTHPCLSDLKPEQVREELARSKQQLEQRLGPVHHFAWPFGQWRHFSSQAAQIAAEVGFKSIASGVRGTHTGKQAVPGPVLLRRCLVVGGWPLAHNKVLLARQASRPVSDPWPAGWRTGSVS